MTINYQQVQAQIQTFADDAPIRIQQLIEQQAQAAELLNNPNLDLSQLSQKVDAILKSYDPNLRCALPAKAADGELNALNARYSLPMLPSNTTVLAADGSQIIPDRHAAVYFGMINVGAIQMEVSSSQPPQTTTKSMIFYDDELYELNEASLALRRDLNEREILAQLADGVSPPVITFTDGPMELWGAKDGPGSSEFSKSLDTYLGVLEKLQGLQIVTAGYVDRPAANLVLRLLEIALLPQNRLEEIQKGFFPLRGVQDIDLFGNLLQPGERSSVFKILSRSAQNYRAGLALHFFYLNVGSNGYPWPVRVEIPAWVAQNPAMLDGLHATLIDQCRIMGQRSYPYALHRAHELAVVTMDDKQQVIQMILSELQRRGIPPRMISHKQSAKNLHGRTRYERGK
jgi:hypothetical protein